MREYFTLNSYEVRIVSQSNIGYIRISSGLIGGYFAPQLIYRRKTFQLIGSVGLFFDEFEKQWSELIIKSQIKRADSLLVYSMITNFPEFLNPPRWTAENLTKVAVFEWLDKINVFVENNTSITMEEFLGQLRLGANGMCIDKFRLGHPVKVLAFLMWLNTKGINFEFDSIINVPITQTTPYERVYSNLISKSFEFQ